MHKQVAEYNAQLLHSWYHNDILSEKNWNIKIGFHRDSISRGDLDGLDALWCLLVVW